MESLKEYLLSKYFSSFGYVVAALHVPALVTFAAFTGRLRTSERRTFRCDVTDCREDCLRAYDDRFNSPFPLYGFVLLCFVPLLVVCIAYSWCFVKSRVDEIEAAMKPDPENPRPRPRVTTRRVFRSYFLHLLVRLTLGILFTVLRNFVFYAADFPTEFVCLVCDALAVIKPTVFLNSTNFNATKVYPSAINCDNPVGSDYATWGKGIWIVNILFALLVFGEMCYLFARALSNNAFTFDSEFCLTHFFNKSRTPVTLRDSAFRLKRRFREDTEYLEPLIASGSESKALDDIFVDLVICTGRAEHEFEYSLERHEIYDIYLKPQHGAVTIEKLEQLFLPNEDTQDPRKILIVGRPGIGKSLLCTKLLRDWSQDEMLRDSNKTFDHFFLFQFRWFKSGSTGERKMSLQQLLSRVCPDKQIDSDMFQDILDNPERVLLIFDGLDELKHHSSCLEDEHAEAGNSPTEQMQFSALYVKLVKGKQLSGATVLTTCRPTVVQSVAGLTFNRTVEIMGFTPEKVQEYVHKHCVHNRQTMNKIWMHISSNSELLSLCYIPVNSAIICSLLEKWITLAEQDSESSLPKTTTQVYTGALRLFIFKHHPEFKGRPLTKDYLMGNAGFSETVEKTLSKLGSLAKAGIEAGQLIFGSTEVQGMENCGLLNRLPDCEVSPYSYTSHFCFIHLTLQELLAAREIAKMSSSDLSDFISSNAADPKWHLVIQFVAGLLSGRKNEAVNSFVILLHDCLTTGTQFTLETKQKALLMLKCLHEYNNDITVKKVAFELEKNSKFSNEIDFSYCQVTPVECSAITHFVKHLEKPSVLNLDGNSITDQGVSHLCDALKDESCKLTELNLRYNSIKDQGVSHLCDALKDEKCNLSELNLSGNSLTDQGVSHLCNALKDEICKLTKLNLYHNSIEEQGVSHPCDALKDENCKLTSLNLGNNCITDQGLSHLFDALKDENCKLTELNLSSHRITEQSVTHWCHVLDQGVSHLRDALTGENCNLTELNLGGNGITDQGLSHLCDALKDENCKLTVLNLYNNSITDQGVSHLCDALKDKNCKLIELNLFNNSITDQGVSHLCDALKDENCKLNKWNLGGNSITDQGASHLCDVLKDRNCKLTKLNLYNNTIKDQGVSHLCDALKDENCKLTELNLGGNSITDQGVTQLCNALKDENCKITELNLFNNSITDQGASHLCDALKDENSKLSELNLGNNSITDQGASHLLNLCVNSVAYQTKRRLVEAQNSTQCKLIL